MSTVAQTIKNDLENKAYVSCTIFSLLDFYNPIRGNRRRQNRSRANSIDMSNEETIKAELKVINETVNFDDPKNIDWALLIVSKVLHNDGVSV